MKDGEVATELEVSGAPGDVCEKGKRERAEEGGTASSSRYPVLLLSVNGLSCQRTQNSTVWARTWHFVARIQRGGSGADIDEPAGLQKGINRGAMPIAYCLHRRASAQILSSRGEEKQGSRLA